MRRESVIVLKFGSSVLRSEADLPRAVHEIYRWLRSGYSVVAVVSAFGQTTDELLHSAREYCEQPHEGAVALLLATGETRATALLTLALDRAGVPAVTLDPARLGLRTSGRVLNAEPVRLNVGVIRHALEQSRVVVVPGFIGQMQDGRTSLLGRGGSDLTALFLAAHLSAERCRLLKDVAGVYDHDPHAGGQAARCYRSLTWEDALSLEGRIVQPKALRLAREHKQKFEVAAIAAGQATVVGAEETRFYPEPPSSGRLRVALLGLGTVGYGVYQELVAHPELFEIAGVAVRNLERREDHINRALLSTDVWEVVQRDCDVVVEALGGRIPAADCIAAALEAGKHVITANKTAVAHDGPRLRELAARNRVHLLCSAAVGGALPVLETLERLSQRHEIRSIRGVLNGTTNFILHELARGVPFDQAVALAQSCGLAEADPTADLDGSDVACKLVLLARAAFGADLPVEAVQRAGIGDVDPRHVFDLWASGSAVRLVGSLRKKAHVIEAEVRPEVLEASHPLARTQREENCIVVELADGETRVLRGKGAGRWPTTEAVFGDLLTLVHSHARRPVLAEEAVAS